VSVAVDKLEGPDQTITYLGIQIDSVQQMIQLPADKRGSLVTTVEAWLARKKCKKRDLLFLIGSLSFAYKVVKPGRMFLRRLIDLSSSVASLHRYVDLNCGARSDLVMWSEFLAIWNGRCFISYSQESAPSLELFTDASGLGCGGFLRGFQRRGLVIWPSVLLCWNCLPFMLRFVYGLSWVISRFCFFLITRPISSCVVFWLFEM